jgi:DMSO/TMAO reductase YedYZ heme-binding membrane subunit
MKRPVRHILMLTTSIMLLAGGVLVLSHDSLLERISITSAWICMFYMSTALVIGPLRRARGELAPANIHIRRDLGIWGALLGLLHFYAGNVVAMNQVYIGTFVRGPLAPSMESLRNQLFSWGSILGLIVALIFLLLLAISSDRALRWLQLSRWKKIQRSAHAALWLTVLHGIAFQLLESRIVPLVLLVTLTIAVFAIQLRGRRKNRQAML